jgi:hypothetical protein
MRLTILGILLLAAASGCASMPAGGAAAAAPPTSATAGATTIVAVAPPATPHMTLWQFLGADQVCADLACKGECMLALLRQYFPALDGPPPPPPIDAPANLESPNPAVKAAAEVKGEEDAAPAKAQALEYLAKVGCGCYPDVQEALVSGLDDCTESVRFAAAQALYKAAGHPCQTCRSSSCCGSIVREKLTQIAYETKDDGCYFEPSSRVRRVARLALEACGGNCPMPVELPEEEPIPDQPEPPPAPAAEMAVKSAKGPTPALAVKEINSAETGAVTRKGIMAASKLHGVPGTDDAATDGKVAVAGATEETEAPHGRVIAKIDGESIYESELDAAFGRRVEDFTQPLSLDEQREMYRDELLWAIDVRLLLREMKQGAAGAKGVQTTAATVAETVTAADETIARNWLEQTASQRVTVTPDQILDRYRRNIAQYRRPAAARWEQVVVPISRQGVTGHEEARQLIQKLRARWLGGRLPPVNDAELNHVNVQIVEWTDVSSIQPTLMRNMVQQLAIGELSEAFEDASGFRMVRVLERRSESTRTVAEVSAAIEAELRRESQQAAENKYLHELRTSATIWTIIPLEEVSAQASELATVSGAAPAPEKKPRTTPGGLLGSQAKTLSAD